MAITLVGYTYAHALDNASRQFRLHFLPIDRRTPRACTGIVTSTFASRKPLRYIALPKRNRQVSSWKDGNSFRRDKYKVGRVD